MGTAKVEELAALSQLIDSPGFDIVDTIKSVLDIVAPLSMYEIRIHILIFGRIWKIALGTCLHI